MKRIDIRVLTILSFFLMAFITYTYGRSITYVYGATELLVTFICLIAFIRYNAKMDSLMKWICAYLFTVALIGGIINLNIKSTILICTPLFIPLLVSVLNIDYKKNNTDFCFVTIIAVITSYFEINYSVFGEFNSNTLGFASFMGISFGFIWIRCAKKKLIPVLIVILGLVIAAYSGSRNVALVGLICIGLIIVPHKFLNNRIVYYTICLLPLIYTIFAADIIDWMFSNTRRSEFITSFTETYSQKAWGMAERADFLRLVRSQIANRDLLTKLFGSGIVTMHGHNLYNQCVLEFGYIGTSLIYIIFIHTFRIAYVMIKHGDNIVYGCVIALVANLLLQGADVYILGAEAYAIVPQVFLGIILQRHRFYSTGAISYGTGEDTERMRV